MDMTLLRNFCAGADAALAQVDKALDIIYSQVAEGVYSDPDRGSIEADMDNRYLVDNITRCGVMFSVGLEVLGLMETRHEFLEHWKEIEKAGFYKTRLGDGSAWMESDALIYLKDIHAGLMAIGADPHHSMNEYMFGRLHSLLSDTAVLVRKRAITPSREHDIQTVMHDYLEAFFPGNFVRDFEIPGPLKNFKPDCGIRDLGVAIEFKYADSEKEVKTALSGIFEDVAGYSGSKDWTRFVAVIYQTDAFVQKSKFEAELRRAKAHSWFPILVNGAGDRKKARSTSPKFVIADQA